MRLHHEAARAAHPESGEDHAERSNFSWPGLASLTGDIDTRKLSQVLSCDGSQAGPGFQAPHCVPQPGQRQRHQAGTAAYLENSVLRSGAAEGDQAFELFVAVSGAISVIAIPDLAESAEWRK